MGEPASVRHLYSEDRRKERTRALLTFEKGGPACETEWEWGGEHVPLP